MTVRIVSSPRRLFRPFKFTCPECHCVLIVDEIEDLKFHEYPGQGEMEGTKIVYVICPNGGHDAVVPHQTDGYRNLRELAELNSD
jgi:hypothetical protein